MLYTNPTNPKCEYKVGHRGRISFNAYVFNHAKYFFLATFAAYCLTLLAEDVLRTEVQYLYF